MNFNENTYEHIINKLSEAGLKATQQRIVIYKALYNSKEHPTAEIIYEEVRAENPSISLGTVYKTLESFLDAGIVHKVYTGEGNMRYDANLFNHNHFYSINTNEIIDFEDKELQELIIKHFQKKNIKNFNIKDIRLQVTGEKQEADKDIFIE